MSAGRHFRFAAAPSAVVAGALAAAAVSAQAQAAIDLTDPVPGHPGVRYSDLVGQTVRDGHLVRPLRHLAGPKFGGEPPDPIVVSSLEVQRIHAGGRTRLVLMADLGPPPERVESATLLALFDDAPRPRLLDAVDVGMDRDTGFSEHPRLSLGPGDDALVTYSEHSNTSMTYATWLLLFVRHDRFALIEDLFAPSSRACGWERLEAPTFAVRPDPSSPYGAVSIAIHDDLKADGDDCGDQLVPHPRQRVWRAEFRWNPARQRFETRSTDLKRLDRSNQASF